MTEFLWGGDITDETWFLFFFVSGLVSGALSIVSRWIVFVGTGCFATGFGVVAISLVYVAIRWGAWIALMAATVVPFLVAGFGLYLLSLGLGNIVRIGVSRTYRFVRKRW